MKVVILVPTDAVADRCKHHMIGKSSSADWLSMGNDSAYKPVNQILMFQFDFASKVHNNIY